MRVLIISDIHANAVALETVLAHAHGRYDAVWCLGDVVGYGPRPNECVDLVRSHAALCVMGNHDWAALGRPGVNVDDFNAQAREAVLWTRAELTEASRAYLEQLPDEPVHPAGAADILVTHASPREPVWEYILTPSIAMANFARFTEELCLVGHTHKPALYRWRLLEEGEMPAPASAASGLAGGRVFATANVQYLQPTAGTAVQLATSARQRLIVNPGSVGQPRDNDARAAYAILDLETRMWRQERVAYPVELAQNQMREAGLPKKLSDRLSFGW